MRVVADVDSLERATVQAVAPEYLDDTVPGWLLPMDPGTVGRAQCAVPLSHDEADPALIDVHIERYRARGFAPAWRLPDLPSFTPFHAELGRRGPREGALEAAHGRPYGAGDDYAVGHRIDPLLDF